MDPQTDTQNSIKGGAPVSDAAKIIRYLSDPKKFLMVAVMAMLVMLFLFILMLTLKAVGIKAIYDKATSSLPVSLPFVSREEANSPSEALTAGDSINEIGQDLEVAQLDNLDQELQNAEQDLGQIR